MALPAAFIAGIALVIFMLISSQHDSCCWHSQWNTLLCSYFSSNADTYFLPFKTPDFVTVFISWLNLNIGFDICFLVETLYNIDQVYKASIQLAFPIFLVIIVIVASEYSSKFAKIIGKGNPVAVLQSKSKTFLFIFCPPNIENTFEPKKFSSLFPYISTEKPYKCSTLFQQNVANFDFNYM